MGYIVLCLEYNGVRSITCYYWLLFGDLFVCAILNTMSDPQNKAPSYNDLVLLASDLREKIQALETETLEKPARRPASAEVLNYCLLSDLDRSVSTFTGHMALDWIPTIKCLANLNN